MGPRAKLLASQSNALRCVHIVAIALHGILRSVLGRQLTDVERHANGIVQHRVMKRLNENRREEVNAEYEETVSTLAPGKLGRSGTWKKFLHNVFRNLIQSKTTMSHDTYLAVMAQSGFRLLLFRHSRSCRS